MQTMGFKPLGRWDPGHFSHTPPCITEEVKLNKQDQGQLHSDSSRMFRFAKTIRCPNKESLFLTKEVQFSNKKLFYT